jgi:predicted outer membrane protein
MSASLNLKLGVVAAGLSCLLIGYAGAQQVQSPGQSRSGRQNAFGQSDRSSTQQTDRSAARRGERTYGESAQQRTANYRGATNGSQAVDRYLAACLLGQNESEVQLSQIAQQKAENAEVKKFAQEMVQDHQKMIQQLQPLAGMQAGTSRDASSSISTRSERTSESAGRTTDTTALPGSSGAGQTTASSENATSTPSIGASDTANSVATADRSGAGSGAVHQLIQIDRQIGERCTQMARDELQQKSGAEFDKCFIGNAIAAHVHALAALEVIGQQTQGQLAQVAQQAQPKVQQHLEQAKQIMKQLEGQAGASGTQAERKSTTRTE